MKSPGTRARPRLRPSFAAIALVSLTALAAGLACETGGRGNGAPPHASHAGDHPAPLLPPSHATPAITAEDVRAHVRALTDERTEGRRAGTAGERLARDYIVRVMAAIGLEPAGTNGRFEAPFEFTAGISLGPDNRLVQFDETGAENPLPLETDWRPLAFSTSGEIEASPIVFAGYGLVAPARGDTRAIDDYRGADPRDRWVLVFRGLPPSLDGPQRQALQRYASLRYKAMVARDRGARGILFVSGPLGRYRHELVPLRFDASLAGTRIGVLSISDTFAERLLAHRTSHPSDPSSVSGTVPAPRDASPLDEVPPGIDLEQIQRNAGRRILEDRRPAPDPGFRHGSDAHSNVEAVAFEIPGVRLGGQIDLETLRATGYNVIGRLRTGREASPETIVLGAHYDHLGHGEGSNSLASGDEVGRVHPGADDNASGVAALLEIAAALADRRDRGESLGRRDFLFAAWSGEELGLLGSHQWAEDHVASRSRSDEEDAAQDDAGSIDITAYLNFDMVGRLREELIVQGLGSSPGWNALLDRAAARSDLRIVRQEDSYLPTDTTSFYTRGVPVLSAFTGIHSEYHTPRDVIDRLDPLGTAKIARLFMRVAMALSLDTEGIAYRAQAESPEHRARSGFRVFLGTVPDYAQTDVVGVRLSGVAPGGPAESAGIRGGDIIVEVDGTTIENLYDYTWALEALRPGVPARILVLRDDERISLEIVPSSRD